MHPLTPELPSSLFGLVKMTSQTEADSSAAASLLSSPPLSLLLGLSSTSCGSTSKNTSTMDGELPSPAISSSKRSTTSSESSCTQSSYSPCTLTSSVLPSDTETFSVKRCPRKTKMNMPRSNPIDKGLLMLSMVRRRTRRHERPMAPTSAYENVWL